VYGWVIDLDGLPVVTVRVGKVAEALRLVQHDGAIMHAGHQVDARHRLHAGYVDNAFAVLLGARPIHVFVLGNVSDALHDLGLTAGAHFAGRAIAFGTV
jgi:hypothetical protein